MVKEFCNMEELFDIFNDVDEEELEIRAPITRAPRRIHERVNNFEKWNDFEFFTRFRMSKNTASAVLNIIREQITPKKVNNQTVSAEVKFFTTLRFYASSSFLINVGDLNGIHNSTVSKIVKEVSHCIASLCPDVISLPTTAQDLNELKLGFYKKAKFPNCIGAVDCTHVKIQSVGGELAECYRSRKGIFTINVQGICDSKLVLRNIVARWPGSSHDSHIFNSSRVRKDFENGLYLNSVLVGDSGYSCTNYLIPPLDAVNLPEERLFQEAQVRTRNPIERCFGVWKRRFPVLALGLRLKLDRVESVIVATAVLHNMCTTNGEEIPPISDEVAAAIQALDNANETQHREDNLQPDQRRFTTRNNLIYEYFGSMV